MQNDTRNHYVYSCVRMPPRMPTQSSSAGRGGPPTSRSPSPRLTPLTPHNTFNEDFLFPDPLAGVLDPGHLEYSIPNPSDELLDHVEPANVSACDDDSGYESEGSETLQDTSFSGTGIQDARESNERYRSASAPLASLKSALTTSRRLTVRNVTHGHSHKRAHFDDDRVVTSDVLLRRPRTEIPLQRRKSAPAKVSTRVAAVGDHSLYLDETEADEDDEVAAAIWIFDEVIEELVEASEEHEEAKEQLAEVSREVAEAMMDSEEVYDEADNEDETLNGVSDTETDAEINDIPTASARHMQHSSVDEDVDESCMEAEGIAVKDFDDDSNENDLNFGLTEEHHRPEVLFSTGAGLAKKLDLTQIEEDPTTEGSNSSAETVIGPGTSKLEASLARRVSDSHAHGKFGLKSRLARRSASMTDFIKLKGKCAPLNIPGKASPAGCAVTSCTVRAAESPARNTVYQHPGLRSRSSQSDKAATRTAQIVRSDSGILQVVWDEQPSTSSSCITLFEDSDEEAQPSPGTSASNLGCAHFQMDKVKTKLAAWSWAREHSLLDEDGKPKWISLLSFEMHNSQRPSISHTPRSEGPLSPPNTERPSGASSGKHSATRSPHSEHEVQAEDKDEDGDAPIELKVRATLSLPPKDKPQDIPSDYLDVPIPQSRSMPSSPTGSKYTKAISRQLSNLAAEEDHFRSHRDSLILLRKREREEEIINQQLMNSRDSMILTRFKFETRYPSSRVPTRPGLSHVRELSPIPDASPPDSRRHSGGKVNVGDFYYMGR